MRGIVLLIVFKISIVFVAAQELFPHAEPASTMPKGICGYRLMHQNFQEQSSYRIKNWYGVRVMYGLTSKWTIMTTLAISNHHFPKFPTDIINYFFNHHLNVYPAATYHIEGINFYSKYRFFTYDKHHQHLRFAFIAQACKSFVAHDDAEPTLMTDNSGVGAGIIGTYLFNRFAVSVTGGYIYPFKYYQSNIDVTFQSGTSNYLEVSTGYRIWPSMYSSYSDVNINFYSEFTFKEYGGAKITQDGKPFDYGYYARSYPYTNLQLKGGGYIDGRFFLQLISNSNSRFDIGVAVPLKNRSYTYWGPMLIVQYQVYLYNNKKKPKINEPKNWLKRVLPVF